MRNFTYYIPTIVHFGKGAISELPKELKKAGERVLLVCGGGSVKRSGLYDQVMELLREAGISVCVLSGVEPNPQIGSVRRGAALCRDNQVQAVLAVGGGSSIDCAKLVAAAALSEDDPWDLVLDSSRITGALPIFAVPTLAATGSEMDCIAVLSRAESMDKLDVAHPCLLPKCAILDPSYTFTVPAGQTAAGTADIMSHILETYFSRQWAPMQDRLAEGLLKTCIQCGKAALENPNDYDARASLLWAASWAINGLLDLGKGDGWSVHQIEHFLSAYHGVTHGVGLAILTPAWMEHILSPETAERFAVYGRNVWGLPWGETMETARKAIEKTRQCFADFGLPARLSDLGIDQRHFEEIAEKAAARGLQRAYVPLEKADVLAILQRSL